MQRFIQSSPRLTTFLRLLFFSFSLFAAFRLLFYLVFAHKAEGATGAEIAKAIFLGLRFDLRLALILALPVLLFSLSSRLLWTRSNRARSLWVGLYTFAIAALLLTYMVDIGYYAYLESRINFRVFEFFKNPLISAHMVYETYNMWLWTPVFAALVSAIWLFFRRVIFQKNGKDSSSFRTEKTRGVKAAQTAALTLGVILGIHSSLGQYPLRWSDAFFTQNMFIASLAMNPVQYIFDTARNSKRDFDIEKVRAHYDVMADYLGVEARNATALTFKRSIPQNTRFVGRPNIIYIVMESMAAYKTGAFGNSPDASPHLDRLAKDGWLFRHFYTPTEGTARSMFCILTGVPDINAKSTSSRNPLIINQHTLINGLKDYDKLYFIGGSAAWGNIRGVYMNNIDGLRMYEDVDLGGPRADVWGLSDLDLFRSSHRILKERAAQTEKPFFALIQTASFHRPYTIPAENAGFQSKKLSKEELTKYGFNSNEEYNSFRFSDHSLGEFFKLVRDEPFFSNSIFIIHGDHGLPHNGAAHLTEGYKHFGLNRFHTPLVFYSPRIDKPKEFSEMTSEPDVWPTLLGLIGHDFPNQALGRNVLAPKPEQKDYAFSYVYYTDPLQIMLYDREHLVYGTENGVESLHLYNSEDPKADMKDKLPEKFKEMSELLTGIFESSKYILHHNGRVAPAKTKSPSDSTN